LASRPPRPRAAEWARTAVRRAGYLLATTPDGVSVWTPLHAVDPTGAVVLVVPATDPLVAAVRKAAPDPGCWPGPGLIAMVEAREESPLPLPCPIRARARLEGRLRELPADAARSGALEIALRRPADELLDLGAGHTALELQSTGSSWSAIPTGTGSGRSWSRGRAGRPPAPTCSPTRSRCT
jgi:hypothetical protein